MAAITLGARPPVSKPSRLSRLVFLTTEGIANNERVTVEAQLSAHALLHHPEEFHVALHDATHRVLIWFERPHIWFTRAAE